MSSKTILGRLGLTSGWSQEVGSGLLALLLGFAVMPILIFFTGSMALGRYEGASLTRTYDSLYQGLVVGSVASWIVVLGPYGFYLLFKALRLWWRVSGRLA
jgi:hypothetical protein